MPHPLHASTALSQVPKALERAGITKEEVEVFELNEAFASQVGRPTAVHEGWAEQAVSCGRMHMEVLEAASQTTRRDGAGQHWWRAWSQRKEGTHSAAY